MLRRYWYRRLFNGYLYVTHSFAQPICHCYSTLHAVVFWYLISFLMKYTILPSHWSHVIYQNTKSIQCTLLNIHTQVRPSGIDGQGFVGPLFFQCTHAYRWWMYLLHQQATTIGRPILFLINWFLQDKFVLFNTTVGDNSRVECK